MARKPVPSGLLTSRVEIGRERGDLMPKAKKRSKQKTPKTKTSKRKRQRNIGTQTQQPFGQDSRRRIGQYGGTGEPPTVQ